MGSLPARPSESRPLPPQNKARPAFGASTTQPRVTTRRHVLQLEPKRPGGNCAKVCDEAFG